jgi:phosphoglycerol transferase MdoB-like AlkP superfamily enzyme
MLWSSYSKVSGKSMSVFFNGGNGYTPFLDSLCHNSYVFVNAYANGKKSIEALPSILSSIPSLLDIPLINSPYQTNQLPGLGKTLRAEGYSSAFYHGSRNGTMGFDGFIGASGFVIITDSTNTRPKKILMVTGVFLMSPT